MRLATLFLLSTLALAGCESKAHKLQQLQAQYNAAYAAYTNACPDEDISGAARMLTGEKLTAEQMAALDAKKKAQEARCKPQADRLAAIQREILAAQQ
jgi:ABC-type transport system involved in cytochrome bd biosynthesis fused ATPase/permease subunit